MHQGNRLKFINKLVLLIFCTCKLSSSLEIVATSRIVAAPEEDADLVCELDAVVEECSWFAPEVIKDTNRLGFHHCLLYPDSFKFHTISFLDAVTV